MSIEVKDLVKTQKAIYRFSEQLGDRVTLLALRLGANYMLKSVRLAAPVKTGNLRRSITVKNSRIHRRTRNGKVGVYMTIKYGKGNRARVYGSFVERGYTRGKTTVKGKHFIQNTFQSQKQQALEIILNGIDDGGKKLIAEIERR